MDVIAALSVLGAIMVLGFIGNYIFNKTQIPSIVWLLFFGLIIGVIFSEVKSIDQNLLLTITEFFGAVAIIIILFDGGINTDLYTLFSGAPRGLLLTVSGFSLSVISLMLVVVGLAMFNVVAIPVENSVVIGVILGAMVGGTSSPIVIPLANRLQNLQSKTKTVVSIESILTDPLSIVVVLAVVTMITTQGVAIDITVGLKNLVSTFSIGAVLGIVFGLVWLPIMHRVRKQQFSYISTLAVVFLVYSVTTTLIGVEHGGTGGGAIACLVFGLVLGNGKKILKMIKYTGHKYEVDEETKHYHALVSFVIRTFFFVFIGVMASFQDIGFILIGIIALIVLLIVRYLTIWFTTYKGNFEQDDKQTMTVLMPRGLAAAILALNLPILLEDVDLMPNTAGFFQDIAFVIILGTAIICTIGVSVICHLEKQKQ